ncbi:hypothetical protein CROQUDRAFT_670047 [Cronartium quercuum f. sp. fusiforme G11]|uniref:Uncharacterized protein n=1 Tax=Cronartium quercuum f. sp. fusiforme G11 TaxID=708437 RepID=A0A9P6TE04_9BASI|nr:hypothetical protein CROQUDRAFT_670047 [Cronartium quercuum f. sp. fusiforme G11]
MSSSSTTAKFTELSQKTLKTGSELASKYGGKLPGLIEGAGTKLNSLLGSYSGPVSYNLAFTKELLKQVYIKEKLTPPGPDQIKFAYSELIQNLKSLNFWKKLIETGEWKRITVYGIEAVGLFSIGEMIGRRHIVGYKLD